VILLEAAVVYVSPEELERAAIRHGRPSSAVIEELLREGGVRRSRALPTEAGRDYLVRSIAELERDRPGAEPAIAAVLRSLAEAARAEGVSTIVLPQQRPAGGPAGPLKPPGFIAAARQVRSLRGAGPAEDGSVTVGGVLSDVRAASFAVHAHVDGVRRAVGKAAVALELRQGLAAAMSGEGLSCRAVQIYAAGLCFRIGARTSERLGLRDAIHTLQHGAALLAEVTKRGGGEIEDDALLVATKSVLDVLKHIASQTAAGRSGISVAMFSIAPEEQVDFVSPPDHLGEQALAACMALAMQEARLARESDALGLDG